MAYLGSTPARAPLSSAQIEDGTIATADIADDAVTTDKVATLTTLATNTINLPAVSGIIEANANFIDMCLVGPSVDGMAWKGAFSNGAVWTSLMLASVETSGSDAQVNIWDLTSTALTGATPLATLTLTGATPTSIAASMGYIIVGTSDQGMHIVDPHGGAWAERTDGWPRSLTTSGSPVLTNVNVTAVAAAVQSVGPLDPLTGGTLPSFLVGYGTGADILSLIKYDGNVWDKAATVGNPGVAFIGDLVAGADNNSGDRVLLSAGPVATIAADDFAMANVLGGSNNIPSSLAITAGGLAVKGSALLGFGAAGLTVADVLRSSATNFDNTMAANVTRTYNTGFLVGDISGAFLANSDTADRSYKANTLTESGTVPSAVVESGAELLGYGVFSTSNFLSRANDADFAPTTGDMTVTGWFRCSASPATQVLFRYGADGTNTNSWLIHVNANGTLRYMNRDSAGNNAEVDSQSIEDDVWHQFCGTTDRTNDVLTLYIDGVAVGSASTASLVSITNTSQLLEIGCQNTGGTPSEHASSTKLALLRMSKTATSAALAKKMYEAEAPMFEANAKVLLQSGSTDAVLDAKIDPLSGKYIVTQTDTQDIFDGLVIETERTVATGGSTFEHGLLFGDAVSEINNANLFASTPATDQRQVNEMVRSMAAELPAGVDLSKAKAWVYFNTGTPTINATYNVESVTSGGTGLGTITWAVPFKTANYVVVTGANDGTQALDVSAYITAQSATAITVVRTEDSNDVNGDIYVACFGELENE
jgi:hypothetical protein